MRRKEDIMPKIRKMPDDPEVADLSRLSDVPDRNFRSALKECVALQQLLPKMVLLDDANVNRIVAILWLAMEEVVRRAYNVFTEVKQDKAATDILATAALIGMVTCKPSAYNAAPVGNKGHRSHARQARLEIAGAWHYLPISGRNFRNHEEQCLKGFRDALQVVFADEKVMRFIVAQVDEGFSPSQRQPKTILKIPDDDPAQTVVGDYVKRPTYETWFRERHNAGQTFFILHGEAGVGKLWLAKRLCLMLGCEPAEVVIRATNQEPLEQDMARFLASQGVDPNSINTVNVRAQFVDVVTRVQQHPSIVVLDDVQDYADIAFLPRNTQTIIVITSTFLPPPNLRAHAQKVVDLEHMQAIELVRMKCPTSTLQEITSLVDELEHRALIIEQACSFVNETGISITQFISRVRSDPTSALDEAVDPTDRHANKLVRTCGMVIAELSSSADTLAILDTFLFIGSFKVPDEHLAMAWSDNALFAGQPPPVPRTGEDGTPIFAECVPVESLEILKDVLNPVLKPNLILHATNDSRLVVVSALRRLASLSVIRRDDAAVTMHSLTFRLFRKLRESQKRIVQKRVLLVTNKLLENERWVGGEALRHEAAVWVARCDECLASIDFTAREATSADIPVFSLGLYLYAALHRAYNQIGMNGRYDRVFNVSSPLYTAATKSLQAGHGELLQNYLWLTLERDIKTVLSNSPASMVRDSVLEIGVARADGKPRQAAAMKSIYLRHDTEWDPIHQVQSIDTLVAESQAAKLFIAGKASPSHFDVRAGASKATYAGTALFQQAHWNDSIAAFEYATVCYEKVVGDMESVLGFMDASWRLARTHLRRGDLQQAQSWIDRARNFAYERCDKIWVTGTRRFHFFDQVVHMRLRQQELECDLAEVFLAFDQAEDIEQDRLDKLAVTAVENFNVAYSLGLGRLVPELASCALRTSIVSPDVHKYIELHKIHDYLAPLSDELQHNFLHYRYSGFLQLAREFIPYADDDSLKEFADILVNQGQSPERIASSINAIKNQPAQDWPAFEAGTLRHAKRFEVDYRMPFWHAHALATLLVGGILEGKGDSWLNNISEQFNAAAISINRPDWIDAIEKFKRGEGLFFWLNSY
ncbi:hypothetical protein [Amycolatopsis sp. H20-H5]|uniref:hypothetical protein n=1 Tax=Amycolatopsis sp. H20-H5 TaxID=3046309 RepID=UPI002DBBD590|nr:hypothetical protein [Amycolatopsis sp. H20-H5]MEC3976224.1 hypothetical protein [Amycolatopsis sp. H20-H5]